MALDFLLTQKVLTITADGDLRDYDNQEQLNALYQNLEKSHKVCFDGKSLQRWNSCLAAAFYQIILRAKAKNIEVDTTELPNDLQNLITLALTVDRKPKGKEGKNWGFLEDLGDSGLRMLEGIKKSWAFLGDTIKSLGRFFTGRAVLRRVDFEFALADCGYKAIGIVSLVSFMVGLILAFVGALQLKMFGAQIYIASLVAIGMTRIMGAIMAGIIMAGRTGASYAATIGTMQVNEEVDALKTLGLPVTDFLVLPRLLSLIITMPFLTMWADIMGMIGGATVAILMLDISAPQYWVYSIKAFELTNFLVGVFHGFMYGIIISCCGCYYGVNCGRNADSVGWATTKAVVSSIVIMIVATGILTSILEALGI